MMGGDFVPTCVDVVRPQAELGCDGVRCAHVVSRKHAALDALPLQCGHHQGCLGFQWVHDSDSGNNTLVKSNLRQESGEVPHPLVMID